MDRVQRQRGTRDAKEGGEGEVSEKPLAVRYFQVLAYLEEAELLWV